MFQIQNLDGQVKDHLQEKVSIFVWTIWIKMFNTKTFPFICTSDRCQVKVFP